MHTRIHVSAGPQGGEDMTTENAANQLPAVANANGAGGVIEALEGRYDMPAAVEAALNLAGRKATQMLLDLLDDPATQALKPMQRLAFIERIMDRVYGKPESALAVMALKARMQGYGLDGRGPAAAPNGRGGSMPSLTEQLDELEDRGEIAPRSRSDSRAASRASDSPVADGGGGVTEEDALAAATGMTPDIDARNLAPDEVAAIVDASAPERVVSFSRRANRSRRSRRGAATDAGADTDADDTPSEDRSEARKAS